jgi:hypothetical protein
MKRLPACIATGLLMAALTLPLAACADTAPRSAGVVPAKAPLRLETAPRKANGSGIEVRYQVEPATAPGQTVRVTLVLDGVTDPTGASVRLAADGGLTLLQDGAARALPAGRTTTIEADVTLQGTAPGYLSVFTTQNGMGSATSIRVPVGAGAAAAPAPAANLKTTPEGEKLIVVPVK